MADGVAKRCKPDVPRGNSLYGPASDELAELMRRHWAAPPQAGCAGTEPAGTEGALPGSAPSLSTSEAELAQAASPKDPTVPGGQPTDPRPPRDRVARRRAEVSARFPGERLVIPAGQPKIRSNDCEYPFRAGGDYAYLTGDQSQEAVLVLEPRASVAEGEGGHDAVGYLLPRSSRENGEFWLDRHGELWIGRRRSLAEAARVLGMPCRDLRGVAEDLKAAPAVPTRVVRGLDARIEATVAELNEISGVHSGNADQLDDELRRFLAELRLVKDDWEISQLQQAVDATMRGFDDVVKALEAAVATSERYVEGTFSLRARVEGNDVGYIPIAAAGPHACTMHWVRNDGPVRHGDLLLLDAGVETRTLYSADLTRTLPVSGTFSPIQRTIYDAVYQAQAAAIAAIVPGARFRDFHESAQRVLAEHLVGWGLLAGPVERVLELGLQRRYTLHGSGHMLGLDVHDCASARTEAYVDGTLRPGMVLTVEPGLYFQPDDLTVPEEYRGIGVRIEDDILVTGDGHRNLSAALPRSSDEVESWVRQLRPPAGTAFSGAEIAGVPAPAAPF